MTSCAPSLASLVAASVPWEPLALHFETLDEGLALLQCQQLYDTVAKRKGRLRTKPVRFSCTLPLLCYIKNPKPTGNKQKPTSPCQTSTPSCGTPVSHTDNRKLSHPSSSTDTQRGGGPLPPAHTTAHTVFLPCRWTCSPNWAFPYEGMITFWSLQWSHYSPHSCATQGCSSNWSPSMNCRYSHWSTELLLLLTHLLGRGKSAHQYRS